MSDPFLAEIRIFPFSYAPQGWATCDGQIMPINQNVALFSLLGVTYGGDGRTTFGLPNFQGKAGMAAGNGAGLTPRTLGETGGTTSVTLTTSQMAAHGHNVMARVVNATTNTADPSVAIAKPTPATNAAFAPGAGNTTMSAQTIGAIGGNGAHNNMQPYLTLLFCIALRGIFPQRP